MSRPGVTATYVTIGSNVALLGTLSVLPKVRFLSLLPQFCVIASFVLAFSQPVKEASDYFDNFAQHAASVYCVAV